MIRKLPTIEEIREKVINIIEDSVDPEDTVKPDVPLMAGQGFDSLDLIETGFSLQEFFEFEFSDKNAIEELSKALGDDSIISESGHLTELGREMVFKRMPELKNVDLPQEITPLQLQQYYTVDTFSRLILEFYKAAPDVCPETGEAVVIEDFKVVTTASGRPVKIPTGDAIIDRWVSEAVPTVKT